MKLKKSRKKIDGKSSPRKSTRRSTRKSTRKSPTPRKSSSSLKNDDTLPDEQILPEQLSKHARHNYYNVDELISKIKTLNRQNNLLGKIIDENLKADNDPIINLCRELLNLNPNDQKLLLAKIATKQGIKDNVVNEFMSGKRIDRFFKLFTISIYKLWEKSKIVSQTGKFVYTLHGNPLVKGSVYLSSYIFENPTALSSYGRTIICDVLTPYVPTLLSIPICIGIYGYYIYVAGDYFFETIRPLTPYKDDRTVDFTSMANHYLYKFIEYNAKHNAIVETLANIVEPLSNTTATAYNISTNIWEKLNSNTYKAIHVLEVVEGAVDTGINIISNIDEKIKGLSETIENNKLLKFAVNSALPLLVGPDKADKADKIMKDLSTALPMPSHISEYPQLTGEDD